MNLFVLKAVAELFATFKRVNFIARLGDNLIKLTLDDEVFYADMTKGQSAIFRSHTAIVGAKKYVAPFDFALQKYCLKADIMGCEIDGNNRILRLKLRKKLEYKEICATLQLEFTGKYTNAIVLDNNGVVLEALHKIAQNTRIVKVGAKLAPLPQQDFTPKAVDLGGNLLAFLEQSRAARENVRLESAKDSAICALNLKKEKLESLLSALENAEILLAKSQEFAKIGYLLQNNMSATPINGALTLKDYEGNCVEFALTEDLCVLNNAQLLNALFAKAKKFKAKSQNIALQERNLRENIDFISGKIHFIKSAKTLSDIDIILPKMPPNAPKRKDSAKAQFESFFIEGVKISLGRNERENIALLKAAKSNDIWMHIRDIPSSHLIIHYTKNALREEILRKAAEILAGFLKSKNANVLADYTRRKFVKIKEGANVVYSHYGTISL